MSEARPAQMIAYDDFIVCTGYPGEEHSLKEFITPDQVMVQDLREALSKKDDDMFAAWDWVCRKIRYPVNFLGQFTDVHETRWLGVRSALRSNGEFFQLPYQTLVSRIGDCFDKSALLGSLLAGWHPNVQVAIGKVKGSQTINHAWVLADRDGKTWLLETTLPKADAWVAAADLPEYEPEVVFNRHFVRAIPDMDRLFCHPTADVDSVLNTIGGCWRCRMRP